MQEHATVVRTPGFFDRRNEAINYLFFIVWPFGVMLDALKHWDRPWSKNIFWLFCIFFGYTFIIAKEGGADSDRYAQLFVQYANSNLGLTELWKSFYSANSNFVDIASPLITFLVSRVTDNQRILFMVFGLVFGYFHSRNVWYVLGKINAKITAYILLLILTFVLFNPIWSINGFRMWTAGQIFLFGTLPYLLEGNKKRLIWSGLAILFHFSFLFPLSILFLFILFKNRINIYVVFFLFTSFIKEIDLQWVQSVLLSILPGYFQQRVMIYTNLDYAETIRIANQSLSQYLVFATESLQLATYVMTLFVYVIYRKFLINKPELMTLFCYSLLLYGFANIFSLVPSGVRFLNVAGTFMFVFFIILISNTPKIRGLDFVKLLSLPLLSFHCLVMIRLGMDYYGLVTVIGNPIFAAFNTDTAPLITGIKGLLHL